MRLVRILRAVFGIPQKQLAERAGISVRELARIEEGEVAPKQRVLDELDRAARNIIDERVRDVR